MAGTHSTLRLRPGRGRGRGGQTVLSNLHAVCHSVTRQRQIFARTLLSNHLLMVTSLPFNIQQREIVVEVTVTKD